MSISKDFTFHILLYKYFKSWISRQYWSCNLHLYVRFSNKSDVLLQPLLSSKSVISRIFYFATLFCIYILNSDKFASLANVANPMCLIPPESLFHKNIRANNFFFSLSSFLYSQFSFFYETNMSIGSFVFKNLCSSWLSLRDECYGNIWSWYKGEYKDTL